MHSIEYPLVNIQIAMENGPVEIVDFPSYKMVDLSIAFCMFTRPGRPCLKMEDTKMAVCSWKEMGHIHQILGYIVRETQIGSGNV